MSCNHLTDLIKSIQNKEKKYYQLVWYARKQSPLDEAYWSTVSPDVRDNVLTQMKSIEEKFPDEIACIKGQIPPKYEEAWKQSPEDLRAKMEDYYSNSDWEHGFNSGCLAAFRYLTAALGSDGQELIGIDIAEEQFPNLDT